LYKGREIDMNGSELRRRLDRLKRPYTELAPRLGLTVAGLHHQMRGVRRVSRQTELLLEGLEKAWGDGLGRSSPEPHPLKR
jgi:hypothetical protein